MRVHTKLEYIWVGKELVLINEEGYDYEGPVALCGGGASDATKQQQQVNLEASQSQLQFNNQLMGLFQQQFSSQQGTLQYLQGVLKPIVQQSLNGQGYDQTTLNAMRTSATDTISSTFQNAQKALNLSQVGQMGGSNILPSGTRSQLQAGLLNQEAQQKSQTQNSITVQNANLAQSNLWNALNSLNGVSAQFDPLGYANSATSGSGAIANMGGAQAQLQNSITQANSNSFFGSMMKTLGSSIGGTLGGGASNMLGGLPGIGGFFG